MLGKCHSAVKQCNTKLLRSVKTNTIVIFNHHALPQHSHIQSSCPSTNKGILRAIPCILFNTKEASYGAHSISPKQ
jgi:hypothetical protein